MRTNISKEKIKEYNNKYYAKHKSELLARHSIHVICPICFGSYAKYHKSRHEKNRYHLSFTNINDPIVQLRKTESEFYRINFNFVEEYNKYGLRT